MVVLRSDDLRTGVSSPGNKLPSGTALRDTGHFDMIDKGYTSLG